MYITTTLWCKQIIVCDAVQGRQTKEAAPMVRKANHLP